MMKRLVLSIFLLLLLPTTSAAYPSREVTATGGPPFNFGVSGTLTGLLLIDDSTMALSFGEVVKLIDLTTFTASSTTHPALNSDDDTDGTIKAIAYDSSALDIVASQDDGDLLFFDTASFTSKPISLTIASGKELGVIAVDPGARRAYVANNTDTSLHLIDLAGRAVSGTIELQIGTNTSFAITDIAFNSGTNDFYVTTDAGGVFVIISGKLTTTLIDVDTTGSDNLTSVAVTPDKTNVYVVNASDKGLVKINASTKTITKQASSISLAANASLTESVATTVTRPIDGGSTTPYVFVAGTNAVSIVNAVNDEVFGEPLSLSVTPARFAASSSSDGYLYLGNTTGSIGVLTANPWITISSLTYSSGSTLASGKTATLNFQSDKTGTYEVRVGGGVTANGTLLASGNVSTADTDISVSISYNTHASSLTEGSNNLFVFVTDSSGNRGRVKTTLTVDTPPPNVTIQSIEFGNGKLYITFARLTEADMKEYNVYVSTDAALALTKADIDLVVTQASSGSTITGIVQSLSNGTTYSIAMEAVDNAGNKSSSRTGTLQSGSTATGTPQVTAGPVGLSGEVGNCSLVLRGRRR